ncbi:MAG: hypothetical protein ACYTET_01615 [Planctomycetota bacterium]|jgi:hypothetical protein
MRLIACLAVIALSISLFGCRSTESYHRKGYDFYSIDKIAIVEVTGAVSGEAVKNQIADFFVMELLDKGYSTLGRSQSQATLNDSDNAPNEVTLSRNVTEAAGILDASVLLFVHIPEFEDEITINAKIADAKDETILWIGTGQAKSAKSLSTVTKDTTGAIVGVFSWGDKNTGTEIEPDDPDTALLPPQAEDTIRRIVHDICKTIPKR